MLSAHRPAAVAPRVSLARGGRAWTLAAVEADAFAGEHGQAWWFAPWGSTRVAMTVQLLLEDRHVLDDGSAVLMVGRGRGSGRGVAARVAAAVVVMLAASALLAALLSPVVPMLLALAVLLLVCRGVPRSWRDRKARKRLKDRRPHGARLVHSVARARWAEPGRGGELLEELHGIADRRGWQLVLETDRPKLVGYYQRHGYGMLGDERMHSGETRWAMVRDPEPMEVM